MASGYIKQRSYIVVVGFRIRNLMLHSFGEQQKPVKRALL